jgi:hypothetical protein
LSSAGTLGVAAGEGVAAEAADAEVCGVWLAQPQSRSNVPSSTGKDLDMEHPVKVKTKVYEACSKFMTDLPISGSAEGH